MAAIEWNDALLLQQPQMDDTHREFVDLMRTLQQALDGPASAWCPHYDALLAHTEDHFAQEERWMAAMGFDAENCHARQHAAVLETLRAVRRQFEVAADAALAARLLDELNQWFALHARTMDAALCETVQRTGFDPGTGRCAAPLDADAPSRRSCGSAACA